MAVLGKNSASSLGGVMFFLLAITLFGGTNALDFELSEIQAVDEIEDDYVHFLGAFGTNENVLMQWGTGVFIAIIVGIVVIVILILVCCFCMCYHCCCKTSPPPYTTLVVANNQPHPMAQPNLGGQMNMQPAPFAHQQP